MATIEIAEDGILAGEVIDGVEAVYGALPVLLRAEPESRLELRDDKRHTSRYTLEVKPFRWSPDKNDRLKAERDISFEEIVLAIDEGGLKDLLVHPNQRRYPGQIVLVVAYRDYVYLVPSVEESTHYVLKTIIPSRKATRDYLGRKEPDEEA